MKLLFIAPDAHLFRPSQGGGQRLNLLLTACERVADVDVVSLGTEDAEGDSVCRIVAQKRIPAASNEGRLGKFMRLLCPWNPRVVFGKHPAAEAFLDEVITKNDYDYIILRDLPNAVQFGLLKYAKKLVIDIDDSPVDVARNSLKMAKTVRNKIWSWLYLWAVQISYNKVVNQIHRAFVCNAEQMVGAKNSVHLPNIPYYEVEKMPEWEEVENRILFVGDLSFEPNKRGLNHFLENVYPLILAEKKDVELHIVGKFYDDELKIYWESFPGVHVMGFVPSLVQEYAEACVSIIPIYFGAGTCIKVLECMQMQTICVSTKVGFRGYNPFFIHGEDCLIAEDDRDFAKKVLQAMSDKNLRKKITCSATQKLGKYFTRENFYLIVKDALPAAQHT